MQVYVNSREARGSDDRCNRRQERNKTKKNPKNKKQKNQTCINISGGDRVHTVVGITGNDDVTYSSYESGGGSDRMAGGVQANVGRAYCHHQGGEA